MTEATATGHLAIIAEFTVPASAAAAIRAALPEVLARTRAEPGCLRYDVAEDVEHPGLFRVSEEWASRDALAAHMVLPAMAEWTQFRRDLGMSSRKVRVLGVASAEDL